MKSDSVLKEKIPDERIEALFLRIFKEHENTFSWKLNAESLLNNLDKIMEGIKRKTDFSQQISGFPVIFLKGGDSDYISREDFRDILKVFPAADIIEVPGAGHWIQVDKPDEVVKYIKKLIE